MELLSAKLSADLRGNIRALVRRGNVFSRHDHGRSTLIAGIPVASTFGYLHTTCMFGQDSNGLQ